MPSKSPCGGINSDRYMDDAEFTILESSSEERLENCGFWFVFKNCTRHFNHNYNPGKADYCQWPLPGLRKGLGNNDAGENLAGAGRITQFPKAADAHVQRDPVTVYQMVIIAGLGKNSPDEKGQFKG